MATQQPGWDWRNFLAGGIIAGLNGGIPADNPAPNPGGGNTANPQTDPTITNPQGAVAQSHVVTYALVGLGGLAAIALVVALVRK